MKELSHELGRTGVRRIPAIGKDQVIRADELENKYRFIRYIEETEKKSILGPSDHRPK